MKVERVSYDVMTPSAARAILESILWKPAIQWRISKIEVLEPIRWVSVRRNEVGSVISTRAVESVMRMQSGALGLFVEEDRQQRAGLFLRDVRYRIHGYFELRSNAEDGNGIGKYLDMFERRAERGQCINQPYLGCREFAAAFHLVAEKEAEASSAIREDRDLGWMLYDLDFGNPESPAPRFFRARLDASVMNIPAWDSEEVRG
jgi:CRISPR-associated protein Cas5d